MPKVKKVKLYIAPDSTHGKTWVDEDDMLEQFAEYKTECDTHKITKSIIDKDTMQAVDIEVSKPITATIKGFCLWSGTDTDAWYTTYADDPRFSRAVRLITAACELDARGKFETGQIPANLAALWMGGYGYSTKQEQDIKGGVPVVMSGEDKLDG